MPTGTVTQVKVWAPSEDYGGEIAQVTLLDDDGQMEETFYIWVHYPGELTPFAHWIARTAMLSLCREALVNKLKVELVTTGPTSGFVVHVALLAP